MDQLLTVAEASRRRQVNPRMLRRIIAAGEFPEPVRRNRRWVRIPADDVEAYVNKLIDRRNVQTR